MRVVQTQQAAPDAILETHLGDDNKVRYVAVITTPGNSKADVFAAVERARQVFESWDEEIGHVDVRVDPEAYARIVAAERRRRLRRQKRLRLM